MEMPENEIVTIEPLSPQEKAMFFKRMIGVWIVAIFMACFLTYLFFYTPHSEEFRDIGFFIIFPIFFYAILLFIVLSHTLNAFKKVKTVVLGIVNHKRTKTSNLKTKSGPRESYQIQVGERWFTVDFSIYRKVAVGHQVKLHCLKNSVFKADVLNDDGVEESKGPHKINLGQNQTNLTPQFNLLDLEVFDADDKKFVGKQLFKTIIFRGVVWLAGLIAIYFAIFLGIILVLRSQDFKLIYFLNIAVMVILAIVYILLNRKTWKLFRDFLEGQKYSITEQVIDKVSSTHQKPSPNSVVVYGNDYSSTDRYFYLQTPAYWLPVNPVEYQNIAVGQKMTIYIAKNSGVLLGRGLANIN